ncbi:hypothetical protein OTB20_08630 [Streptomyces sp. H27-H1]|uniref:hypothetical protein n=1 Tax=Streptomyces sp. H27-H1 TaxID=2996461 RepID=UPI00226FD138|nr:hypothetical protein [Streptomyces sp. H27-H1]MCY0926271.1 hypothetical protein [Streptomyces sp. H27-H1]
MTYAVLADNGATYLEGPFDTEAEGDRAALKFRSQHADAEAGEVCPWHPRCAYDSCPGN